MRNRFIICHGFNPYFSVPKLGGIHAKFRTAIVLKFPNPHNNWYLVENEAYRILQHVADALLSTIKINFSDSNVKIMHSIQEVKEWEFKQKQHDSDFVETPPSKILYEKKEKCICLALLEDWSDIGKIEPYNLSYTYSFYSMEQHVDQCITSAIFAQLKSDVESLDVEVVWEMKKKQWYWPLLDVLRKVLSLS